MLRTRSSHRTLAHAVHRQAGAALVVGLLLLLVLTVLAVSGMNSSSLSLMMAGNTQYSQNAFQAAEAGIERAIAGNEFNPDPNLDPETQTDVEVSSVATYTAISTPEVCGQAQPALPGSSQDAYSTYHFQIESTGTSRRGATAKNIQAIALIAPAVSNFAPVETCDPDGSGGGAEKPALE